MGSTIACETIEREKIPAQQLVLSKTRYGAFLEGMKRSRVYEGRKEIRETDTDFISTFQAKKGSAGKVMELHCPESKAVSICGQSQADHQESPYFFTLRCFDESGREQSPSTKMNFKVRIENGDSPLWKVSYSGMKRCHFPEGIFLNNGTKLELEVINPDIDIDKVEVAMEVDVFGEP